MTRQVYCKPNPSVPACGAFYRCWADQVSPSVFHVRYVTKTNSHCKKEHLEISELVKFESHLSLYLLLFGKVIVSLTRFFLYSDSQGDCGVWSGVFTRRFVGH